MSITFGTGGWRAIIGDGFTKANVQRLALALARKMEDEGAARRGFLIGYDRRFLSREAAHWAAEVMAGAGVRCLVVEREAPTPLIMFAVKYYELSYGMAVTASHNPALYNGVKVFTQGGRDADETVTGSIEDYIAALPEGDIPAVPYGDGLRRGQIEIIDPMNPYIDSIIRSVNMDAIRSRGLRVVLDPMFGVSKTALQTILITARCDVDVIHERRDALFGGRLPAPNSKTLIGLQSFVLENGCDIGIATDGDADRLGVIDDRGEFLHPNKILVLLYDYLLRHKGWHGAAVRNIATTHLLDAIAAEFGETCYEVPVGFKHVSGKMLETGAVIGGERRAYGPGPHPGQGRHLRRRPAGGDDGGDGPEAVRAVRRYRRPVRLLRDGGAGLPLLPGGEGPDQQAADGGPPAARLRPGAPAGELCRRLQGLLPGRGLGAGPVLGHGAAAAGVLRDGHGGAGRGDGRPDGAVPGPGQPEFGMTEKGTAWCVAVPFCSGNPFQNMVY